MTARSARRGLLIPCLFTAAGLAVLIGLGTWQVERKAWKEALIATLARRLASPPVALPPAADWPRLDPADAEFRRVRFTATFAGGEALVFSAGSALRRDVSGPGYWVFAAAELADGSRVVVDRGFVPESRRDPASRAGAPAGPVEIVGALRWPESRGLFTPADEPQKNLWFARDHLAMAAEKHWGAVAPFYVALEEPSPPGGLPVAGKIAPALPNNHLQYAITWYGLAVVLAVIFALWLRRRLKAEDSGAPPQPPGGAAPTA